MDIGTCWDPAITGHHPRCHEKRIGWLGWLGPVSTSDASRHRCLHLRWPEPFFTHLHGTVPRISKDYYKHQQQPNKHRITTKQLQPITMLITNHIQPISMLIYRCSCCLCHHNSDIFGVPTWSPCFSKRITVWRALVKSYQWGSQWIWLDLDRSG